MSTIKVNTIQTTSGVEVFTAKAWVNFNGTGTVSIRGSGNVSSITDIGAGSYRVNFTNAIASQFAVSVCSTRDSQNPNTNSGGAIQMLRGASYYSSTYVDVQTINPAWAFTDAQVVTVVVHA